MRCYASANLIWSELEIGVDVPLAVELDRSSPVPLYYQLAQAIEAAIRDGELAPGDRFENELALAGRLSLSRPTTRRAIQELVDKGLLVRKRGVGTQVHYIPVHRQPYYQDRYGPLDLPGADAWYARALTLPLFPGMADDDPGRVVEALRAVLGLS